MIQITKYMIFKHFISNQPKKLGTQSKVLKIILARKLHAIKIILKSKRYKIINVFFHQAQLHAEQMKIQKVHQWVEIKLMTVVIKLIQKDIEEQDMLKKGKQMYNLLKKMNQYKTVSVILVCTVLILKVETEETKIEIQKIGNLKVSGKQLEIKIKLQFMIFYQLIRFIIFKKRSCINIITSYISMNAENDDQIITQTQILQMLHRQKMAKIEHQFQIRQKGLPIDDFVSVMLKHLDYDKDNQKLKMKLTLALIDFFKQVDVNGDQTMQWDQFSNHIIELGLLRNDRSFKNVIKSYFPSDRIVDKQKHQSGIENIYYFEKLKNLFLIEKESSRFKVYNVNTANLLYEVNAHKGNVLDLQYLQNQNLIATSSNDLTINFWDASSFTLKQIVSVPQIQLRIKYANWTQANKQLLYTGGSDAIIHIYDASTLKQKGTISGWNPFYKSDQQQEGHCSPIGDILPIDSQQTLVTACLSGNICLWDCNNHQLKKQLKGHDKGVYSLDWCSWSQMNQCLLSAGLDHQAYVWNTYVKDKIFLLRGHNHPLVGVKCLPESPQIITADIAGMVKVWDVRNFLCIQTFNAPVDELNSFCLTYSTNQQQSMKKRIICSGKKIHYFEYDQPKDQFLADEKSCIKVLFNYTLLCFITMHIDSIKVWDAKNGKLLSVYRGLCSNPAAELTAMILDIRQRKLFVGDNEGSIYTVNIKNGAKMKEFQKHSAMVTGLAYWSSDKAQLGDQRYQDMRRIISISRDPEVYIHDEDSPEDAKSSCRYIMKQHQLGCNSIDIRQGTEYLVSGSEDGLTIITNLISYRHQILPKNSQNQIKHVLFLNPFQCLATVDSSGNCIFYGVGDNKFKHKIILEKQYMTQSMTNQLQPFPITALAFDRNSGNLILGDQFGNIQCWDVTQLLENLSLTRIEKSKLSKRRQTKQAHFSSIKQSKIIDDPVMITEIRKIEDISFDQDIIKVSLKLKGAHSDGITSIELVKQNQAFITSSFDCSCHVWSLIDGKKLGSLLLGGDINWKVKFNLQSRQREAEQQAQSLLKRLHQKRHFFYSNTNNEDDIKSQQRRRNQILRQAKDIMQQQRKIYGHQEPIIDILGETNQFQKQFFNQQEQQSQYNLMNEVSQFKNNYLDQMTSKKGKSNIR